MNKPHRIRFIGFLYVFNRTLVIWNDGTSTELLGKYELNRYPCEFYFNCYHIYDIDKIKELEKVGQSDSNLVFYKVKNATKLSTNEPWWAVDNSEQQANALLNNQFHAYNESIENDEEVMSFEEFSSALTMLFWEDPFGRIGIITDKNFSDYYGPF